MSELVETVNGVFEKISEVIDLSFFPPGAACLAAALYWNQTTHSFHLPNGGGLGTLPGWFQASGAILGSYVLGLLCFTAGRWLRGNLGARVTEEQLLGRLRDALAAHGLLAPDAFPAQYLERKATRPLQARMWAEIREDSSLRESYKLLQHYWVMAATYDGMATAFLLWAAVFIHRGLHALPETMQLLDGLTVAVAFLLLMAASIRESKRLAQSQIEELTATLARRGLQKRV